MTWTLSPGLLRLGFTPFFLQQLHALAAERSGSSTSHVPARVACERRGELELFCEQGSFRAKLSGRLEHELTDDQRPAVGDWVVAEPADPIGRVHHLLERQSALCRVGVDGTSRAQTLAANVDLCCVVCALTSSDADVHSQRRALNPKRIERYLVTARASRVPALVLVNKADLLPAELARERLRWLREKLPEARVLLVSAHSALGFAELSAELSPGTSAALLGSSGVGKSSLVNALLGQALLSVSAERADDARGRHTTTERQLLELPGGGLVIDTPGMRELRLWADAEGELPSAGSDAIEALAHDCHFRDCRHEAEPGCAVQAAIAAGQLERERLDHAHKLERELAHQQARAELRLRRAENAQRKAKRRQH